MIKSNRIGQSPGDEGDSPRQERPACPSGNADLIETAGTADSLPGDVTEGSIPRKTISSTGTASICRQWEREIEQAISSGSRTAIRIALFAASHWAVGELARATPPLSEPVLAEICLLQLKVVAVEIKLGEWYTFQMGCESRMGRKLMQDWRKGLLNIGWSQLQYAVLPRLHMLPTNELIVDSSQRRELAEQLADLDWRPM